MIELGGTEGEDCEDEGNTVAVGSKLKKTGFSPGMGLGAWGGRKRTGGGLGGRLAT